MDDFVGGKYRGFPEEIGLQSKFCLTLKNKIYEKKTQQRSTIVREIQAMTCSDVTNLNHRLTNVKYMHVIQSTCMATQELRVDSKVKEGQ